MNLYEKVLNDIEIRRQRLKDGKINAIPFPFPGLSKFLPGIIPESQIGLTTISGGGKTTLTTNLFVQTPFDYWMTNKDKMDFDIKIFLFCLEDSPEMTIKRFMLRALWTQLGIRVDMYEVDSYFQGRMLSDDTKRAMDSLAPYFEIFLSKVELLDVKNPTGIANHVKNWLKDPKNGNITDEKGNILTKEEQHILREKYIPMKYKPINDNRFVIVAVDNLQNVSPEKGMDKWQAQDRLCRQYLRNDLCGFYKTSNFIVAQQTASVEEAQYTGDGDVIEQKFIPSLANIAEYKNIVHTCHIMLGLFSPYRYLIPQYTPMGLNVPYDITKLQDFYRNIYILKGNFVGANLNTSLMFDGITGVISELPNPRSEDMKAIYLYCEKMIKKESGLKPLKIA